MSAISLGVLITAIDGVGHGERTEWVIFQAVAALAVGAVLVTRELSRSSPLVPVDLMRIPLFALSICTSICAFTAQSMAMVSLPFLFESTLGLGQVRTGLLMTPWPLVVAVIAPFTGRLADRYPVGILSGAGLTRAGDRAGAGQFAAGASEYLGYCVADADLRVWLRVLQYAEQPGDHHVGAEPAIGWRLGDAGLGSAGRADRGGVAGGAGVRAVSGEWDDDYDGVRGSDRAGGGGGEYVADAGAVGEAAWQPGIPLRLADGLTGVIPVCPRSRGPISTARPFDPLGILNLTFDDFGRHIEFLGDRNVISTVVLHG